MSFLMDYLYIIIGLLYFATTLMENLKLLYPYYVVGYAWTCLVIVNVTLYPCKQGCDYCSWLIAFQFCFYFFKCILFFQLGEMVEDLKSPKGFSFLDFGSIKLVQIKARLEDVCLVFIM
jgi:hypothetical protein